MECLQGSARQATHPPERPYSDHMTSGVFGGGVIFVVAALLWAAVLVPSWVRRREFKSAEQNAMRLQRTLRVLAETAEVPTEVRVEATAREALAQERLLRTAQKRQEAERKAQLAEARAAQVRAEMRAQQMKRKQEALVQAAKLRRPIVRRIRSLTALVFVIACVAILVGAGLLIGGLGSALLTVGLAAAAAAVGALVLLAPGRVKHVEIDAEHYIQTVPATAEVRVAPIESVDRAAEAHAAAQAAAAARIDRARAMARARAEGPVAKPERLQNKPDSILLSVSNDEAQAAPTHTPSSGQSPKTEVVAPQVAAAPATQTPKQAEAAAVAKRLNNMGVVGDTSDGMLDLDAVLRTRRRAG